MRRECIRVLHVIAGLETGGTETMLSSVVSGLPAVNSRVVALGKDGPLGSRLRAKYMWGRPWVLEVTEYKASLLLSSRRARI